MSVDFIRPTSTPLLLKELRSAACYAELAVQSGTWDPNDIETKVFDRSYKKTGPGKRRGTFYKAMNGTVVQPRYLLKIESVFPGTRIRWWRDHPLAEILCNAALEQDGVLKALGTCAAGQERQLMWDENYVGMLSWERFRVEVPDSVETIAALVQIGSVESLLVLVGRMRLAQLRGARGSLDMEYERAIWQVLPTCVARSPHLYLGHEALFGALDGFLSWSPFSDSRFLAGLRDKRAEELRLSFFSRLSNEVARLRVQLPPEEHLLIRKRVADGILDRVAN
jgi:hypothetical protein